MIIWCKVRPGM